MIITIDVPGIPKPGGSKTGTVIRRKDGSIVTKNGRPLIAMRDASGEKGKNWRSDVKQFARNTYTDDPLEAPLAVHFAFRFPRPKAHFNSKGELKPSAPAYPDKKPDATKLVRAAEDALTGIIYNDDARIVRQFVTKDYSAKPGCTITVRTLLAQDRRVPVDQLFAEATACG